MGTTGSAPWSLPLLLTAASLFSLGLGGCFAEDWGFWIAAMALAALALLLLNVIVTGAWYAPAGYFLRGGVAFWPRGVILEPLADALGVAGRFLFTIEPLEPWWLLLLLLLPLIVWLSFRSLSGLGPVRRWVAIGLRCLGIALRDAGPGGNPCPQAG